MRHLRAGERQWEEGPGYRKRRLIDDAPLPAEVSLVQEVRFPKGASVPDHLHRVQTEVFVALAPGTIIVGGEEVRMAAGDVVVCEPGEVHSVPPVEGAFGFLVLKIDYREDDTEWL